MPVTLQRIHSFLIAFFVAGAFLGFFFPLIADAQCDTCGDDWWCSETECAGLGASCMYISRVTVSDCVDTTVGLYSDPCMVCLDGIGCSESECLAIDPGGGNKCAYIGNATDDDLCVSQTAAGSVCATCDDEGGCTESECLDLGGGATCEFVQGYLSANRCVEAGTMAKVEADAAFADFWASTASRAPKEELDYALLEPSVFSGGALNLCTYTGEIFRVVIGIAGVLAVLMLVVGGFQFVAGASNPSARAAAKERVTYAIIGLLLALGSWVILNTINEDLINSCNPPPTKSASISAPPAVPKDTTAPTMSLQDTQICIVMDDTSTVFVEDYAGGAYDMRYGLTATDDATDVTCFVDIKWQKKLPMYQKGSSLVYYNVVDSAGNAASQIERTVLVDTYLNCQSKAWFSGYELWDFFGSGVGTTPVPPAC